MILFPDTNFFLQFKDAPEVPWRDITEDSEVVLMVCRTVQGEIDDLKGNGNSRRADRARKASARFRTMVLSDAPLVLREANPRLVLEFAPRAARGSGDLLALGKKDDQIVAEVMAAVQLVESSAALLTDDTGMMLTAKHQGLPLIPTPEEWRLQPEKDERDKKIADLKAQVTRLSQSVPQLEVHASSAGSPLTAELAISRMEYAPLGVTVVDELVEAMCRRYPEKTDFSLESDEGYLLESTRQRASAALAALGSASAKLWKAPTQESIAQYSNKYRTWMGEIRSTLVNLHDRLPDRTGTAALSFSLRNTGTVPAEGLLIDIEALGGLLLSESPEKNDGAKEPAPCLPGAPNPPAWTFSHPHRPLGASLTEVLRGLGQRPHGFHIDPVPPAILPYLPKPEDPCAFFWRDKPVRSWVPAWGFRCAEFRHQAKAERFEIMVVAPGGKSIQRGAIRFRASARNLPEPIEHTVQVRAKTVAGDTEAAARAMIPKSAVSLMLRARRGPTDVDI